MLSFYYYYYTDDEVRTAAKGTSFHEISNTKQKSRVISFENDSGTRINYCLLHHQPPGR